MKQAITLLDDDLFISAGQVKGMRININIGPQLTNILSPYSSNTVGISNVLGTINHGHGNIFLGGLDFSSMNQLW